MYIVGVKRHANHYVSFSIGDCSEVKLVFLFVCLFVFLGGGGGGGGGSTEFQFRFVLCVLRVLCSNL